MRAVRYVPGRYEEQVAQLFDRVRLPEDDVETVLRAMRTISVQARAQDPAAMGIAREELQTKLAAGTISLDAFSRAWRGLDRPPKVATMPPDELRLRRARKMLSEFGTLWWNPAVPDQLREEALRENFSRVDVDGAEIVAVHPAPNENAWLLGLSAVREQRVDDATTGGTCRGERARASATRQIRGCRVTVGGRQGPVDLFLTA